MLPSTPAPHVFLNQRAFIAPPHAFVAPQRAFVAHQPAFVAPQPFVAFQKPLVRSGSADANAQILRSDSNINPDGSYAYGYETDNAISVSEHGQPKALSQSEQSEQVQGSYSYISPEGIPIKLSYVADENGFQPSVSELINFYIM